MGNLWSEPENKEEVKDDLIFGKIEFPEVELEKDEEGYCKSFTINQEEEYMQFFEKYGFVIINDVFSKEDCEATVIEIWDLIENKNWRPPHVNNENKMVDRNDTTTWGDDIFPPCNNGIFGDIALGKMAWKNRQNENMYQIFSTIAGNKQLWVSLDRLGIMRPTKNVPVGKLPETASRSVVLAEEGSDLIVKDFPEWKTRSLWLHWDLNPLNLLGVWTGSMEGLDYTFTNFISENNGSRNKGDRKLQGLLTLVDSQEGDGGFCCVPGFHNYLKQWAEQTRNTAYADKVSRSYSFVNVPPNDHMTTQAKKISSRAGSLLVWSSELPHCNYPNDSNRFRINQYIKFFPAQEGAPNTDARKDIVRQFTKDVGITELGMKILGLENW